VWVAGKRVRVVRRHGRWTARVDLRGVRKGRFRVRAVIVTRSGRRVIDRRRYRTCVPGRRSSSTRSPAPTQR
jgi:hypothetical protein